MKQYNGITHEPKITTNIRFHNWNFRKHRPNSHFYKKKPDNF